MLVNGVRLSEEDLVRLKNSARVAQDLENLWDRVISQAITTHARDDSDRLPAGGDLIPPNFDRLFVEHYFQVHIEALKLAEAESELEKRAPKLMAQPRSLAQIMKLYDRWKKGLFKPKGPLARAKEMKNRYIDAVQKAWKKYSYDFRHGGETTQAEIRELIREAAKTTVPRAQTIVRTETTRYYNEARRAYYDKAGDVTHYLFLAIRDKATTKWCTSGKVNGKRGRSGLVYAKDDPLLEKETPPVHWNCRSELLPLNRFNPSHRRLIENKSIQRRAHVCTVLPPDWNK